MPTGAGAKPPQLVLLGRGEEFTVADASPGTRYLLMAGKPFGEAPVFNGPFVDYGGARVCLVAAAPLEAVHRFAKMSPCRRRITTPATPSTLMATRL